MRSVLLAMLMLLAPMAARAQALTEPPPVYVAMVYDQLARGGDYETPDALYTPRLLALWKDMQKDAGDEVGRVDFFPWTNSQDWTLSDLSLTSEIVDGRADRMIVTAKFRNGDRPEIIRTYWEKSDDRWRLDDMQSAGADAWTLSVVLKYGWSSQELAETPGRETADRARAVEADAVAGRIAQPRLAPLPGLVSRIAVERQPRGLEPGDRGVEITILEIDHRVRDAPRVRRKVQREGRRLAAVGVGAFEPGVVIVAHDQPQAEGFIEGDRGGEIAGGGGDLIETHEPLDRRAPRPR